MNDNELADKLWFIEGQIRNGYSINFSYADVCHEAAERLTKMSAALDEIMATRDVFGAKLLNARSAHKRATDPIDAIDRAKAISPMTTRREASHG